MIYTITSEFTKLNESQGTVQNSSNIFTLELSDSNIPDSGVLIYPLNQLSFSGTKYLRCVDGTVQARVVAFAAVAATDNAAGSVVEDDNEDVINDIWNNAGDSSAVEHDEFSDVLDNIFNP